MDLIYGTNFLIIDDSDSHKVKIDSELSTVIFLSSSSSSFHPTPNEYKIIIVIKQTNKIRAIIFHINYLLEFPESI